jgi:hypothetical protein
MFLLTNNRIVLLFAYVLKYYVQLGNDLHVSATQGLANAAQYADRLVSIIKPIRHNTGITTCWSKQL